MEQASCLFMTEAQEVSENRKLKQKTKTNIFLKPHSDNFRFEIRIVNPWRAKPQLAVIIPQTEPPQTDNTLIEALTSPLRFVTIRRHREKPLIRKIRGSHCQ
ncbi:hypothetical protein QUA81_00995 [Microcoleus sp. F6_B4]